MRWKGRRKSDNVVDRRGTFARGGSGRKVGGGAAVLVILAGLFFGPEVQNILGLFIAITNISHIHLFLYNRLIYHDAQYIH